LKFSGVSALAAIEASVRPSVSNELNDPLFIKVSFRMRQYDLNKLRLSKDLILTLRNDHGSTYPGTYIDIGEYIAVSLKLNVSKGVIIWSRGSCEALTRGGTFVFRG
jgi:hypothetical protein